MLIWLPSCTWLSRGQSCPLPLKWGSRGQNPRVLPHTHSSTIFPALGTWAPPTQPTKCEPPQIHTTIAWDNTGGGNRAQERGKVVWRLALGGFA